jgi:hypothetical protein
MARHMALRWADRTKPRHHAPEISAEKSPDPAFGVTVSVGA